ncbi:AGAP009517-PA, partial [Anopheles gambiae str. PEST]
LPLLFCWLLCVCVCKTVCTVQKCQDQKDDRTRCFLRRSSCSRGNHGAAAACYRAVLIPSRSCRLTVCLLCL